MPLKQRINEKLFYYGELVTHQADIRNYTISTELTVEAVKLDKMSCILLLKFCN